MTKQIHTHRAHCQLCVRVQAIDVATGIVAKHGYTVAGGYFSGTCPGSDMLNLHVERTNADASIANARRQCANLTATAAEYRAGNMTPDWGYTGEERCEPDPSRPGRNRYVAVVAPWGELSDDQRSRNVSRIINELEQVARAAKNYADQLQLWADKIHGKIDPYQVKDLEPRDWQVGDEVTIGSGHDKFTATIDAIELQKYQTFGFRRGAGSVMCNHMRVTRPAREARMYQGYEVYKAREAKQLWFACRDVKRPKNKLAAELKKAGLL